MIVLTYGFKQPQTGDKGSVWFAALNDNISQLNDHTHDGVTSSLISATSMVSGSVSIPSASWVADGTGRYRQDVTVPAGFNMTYNIQVIIAATGHIINPTIEKLSATTFRIYTPDNSLTYTAYFR
jgi:hypothetical protein